MNAEEATQQLWRLVNNRLEVDCMSSQGQTAENALQLMQVENETGTTSPSSQCWSSKFLGKLFRRGSSNSWKDLRISVVVVLATSTDSDTRTTQRNNEMNHCLSLKVVDHFADDEPNSLPTLHHTVDQNSKETACPGNR